MSSTFRCVVVVCGLVFLGACSRATALLDSLPPGALATNADLVRWSKVSAPQVYMVAISTATLASGVSADAGCPLATTSGDVTTYTGNCTTPSGRTFFGSMTARSYLDGGIGTITYSDFGYRDTQDCNGTPVQVSTTLSGSLVVTSSGDQSTFDLELRMDNQSYDAGCAPTTQSMAVDYAGTSNDATDTWNGSGRIGNTQDGVVRGETVDEVTGGSCVPEAESGQTTIRAGAKTGVITYDGASDCDLSGTVTWTLDGVAMGQVSGVNCGVVPSAAPVASALVLAALCFARLRGATNGRRRADPRRSAP